MSAAGATTRWLRPDSWTAAAGLMFLATVITEWRDYVRGHEAIYLLGPRRVADPGFLAHDLSWADLPPNAFLFNQLVAPFWSLLGDFGTVSLGRAVTWALLTWSLATLAREMRLPPWSTAAGFVLWLLWDQTLAICGKPLEGVQPKMFAYPLVFFALAFVIRGAVIRAGIAAGLATAFHIIIGGWGCVALAASMLVNRRLFPAKAMMRFVVATATFVLPLVVAVAVFHGGGVTGQDQALMDRIYVTFAWPECCDPDLFLDKATALKAAVIFPLAVLLLFLWPEQPGARVAGAFVLALVGLFLAGLMAHATGFYALLKLFPFQLANAIPALFLFVMCCAFLTRPRSRVPGTRAAWLLGLLVCVWLIDDENVLSSEAVDKWQKFVLAARQLPADPVRNGAGFTGDQEELYAWIRDRTDRDSVFVTPHLPEFWTYAERAQVASMRHPPFDRHIIEWKARLEALNGSRPFVMRGFDIVEELALNEGRLTLSQLQHMRQSYAATYYLTYEERSDFAAPPVFANDSFVVYDLRQLGIGQPASR